MLLIQIIQHHFAGFVYKFLEKNILNLQGITLLLSTLVDLRKEEDCLLLFYTNQEHLEQEKLIFASKNLQPVQCIT